MFYPNWLVFKQSAEVTMPTTFRSYQPDQLMMFPPSLREWLPEGHLAYFVSDVVDRLDMTVFHAPYEGYGRRNMPYDPVMMLKLLIYAYAVGVFSSRKIAKMLEENVAMRMLVAGNRPSHHNDYPTTTTPTDPRSNALVGD